MYVWSHIGTASQNRIATCFLCTPGNVFIYTRVIQNNCNLYCMEIQKHFCYADSSSYKICLLPTGIYECLKVIRFTFSFTAVSNVYSQLKSMSYKIPCVSMF